MHRFALPVAAVLVVGLLVGGYLVERAAAQVSTGSHSYSTWPPPPQEMVDRQGAAVINPLTYQTLFDVPSDRWFILTDGTFPFANLAYELGEELGGTFTVRIDFHACQWFADNGIQGRFHSATGLAFPPGSKVKLFNSGFSPPVSGSFNIVGYLVPK